MKYVVFILVFFSSERVISQDLISVASTFLNDKNYIEAKSSIDEAFEKTTLVDNPGAWFMKARIYHEILLSNDRNLEQFKQNRNEFVGTIVEAYNKTIALSVRTSNFNVLAKNQIEILWAYGINEGQRLFQAQAFDKAIEAFEIAKITKPSESRAYISTAVSALYAGKYQLAIDNYLAVKDIDDLPRDGYDGLILAKRNLRVSDQELLEVVGDARFDYPNHVPFIIEEVRTLIRLDRLDAAESVLNTAVKRNPNDARLILRQADLFDIIFKDAYINGEPERSERYFEMASTNYERFLNRNALHFAANYNYAVMINEQANRVYTRINLMSNEEYEMRGRESEEIGHDWTRKALPYMEKAWELKPGDTKVMQALEVFYKRLKLDDKLAALNGN
ncbi:hypothetical protein BFP97_14580 [Roseivirga sp. 4D4]|uniref:tetratricopeptide repeat protein n=1 Tax=Roseivirga sp. 4D4 TaxID=1889784 RepID=UPI0008528F8A|nr:tetratricopeptide repeat protein [Roseivirga sp. 4D4]OEK02673.1 hypothetical protein BFP97_14580 [Roseivirga sp. 4D4]